MARAFEAVDAYTNDRRVIGNSLMAVARVHISAVDEQLAQMVARLRDQAARASETAQLRSAQAVRVSWAIRRGHAVRARADDSDPALDRAAARPHREAMAALTSGRTDVEISLSGHDELAPWRARWRCSARAWSNATAWPTSASRPARLEVARDEATAANQILQVTFDHMAQGVTMFDGGRQAGGVEPAVPRPAGPAGQLLSKTDLRRIHPPSRGSRRLRAGRSRAAGAQAVASLGKPYVGARTLPDGRVLEVRRNPVPGDGFVSMYTEITQQRQAQAQIELARNRLSDAIQSISDGFALWDQEDRLVTFNDRCRQLLRLENQFAVGMTFEALIRALAGRRARRRRGRRWRGLDRAAACLSSQRGRRRRPAAR